MEFAPLRLPKALLGIGYEIARHVLRRPVVGIAVAARAPDGRYVMIRRGDTGTWAFPGGTLEWGETLRTTIERELDEEAGITRADLERVIGIYSRPDRDVRFHAVTTFVECAVSAPSKPQKNPLEIRDVALFRLEEIPRPLAMGMDDLVDALRGGGPCVLE